MTADLDAAERLRATARSTAEAIRLRGAGYPLAAAVEALGDHIAAAVTRESLWYTPGDLRAILAGFLAETDEILNHEADR